MSSLKQKNLIEFCDHLDYYHWNKGIPESIISKNSNTILHPVCFDQKLVSTNKIEYWDGIHSGLLERAEISKSYYLYAQILAWPYISDLEKLFVINEAKKYLIEEPKAEFIYKSCLSSKCNIKISSSSRFSEQNKEHFLINKFPDGVFSIHTEEEIDPFVIIEYRTPVYISSVFLFDRSDIKRDFLYRVIVILDDGETVRIYESKTPEYIGGLLTGPKKLAIDNRIKSIKISIIGQGMLHFDSIFIAQ